MKYFQQLDISDCGAACLAMIASYYGLELSIADIREKAGTDTKGTNLNGMVNASGLYGLKATPMKGNINCINKKLPVPFIIHIKLEENGTYLEHYVVVKKIYKNKVYIYDPDPLKKKYKISIKQLEKIWTGYIIFFEPTISFSKVSSKSNLLLKFIPILKPYKKILLYSLFISILLLLFGLISSFYFKYIFDEVIYTKSILSINSLSFAMLIISLIQISLGTFRKILLSHFSFKTDIQLNFSYLTHIFKLPISFFESRKSGEILSRLGDLDKIKQTLSSTALSGIMDLLMIVISAPILLKINSPLFLVSLITVLIASIITFIYSKIYRSYYPKIMSKNAEVQSYLYESLNGVATIKALNAESLSNKTYEIKKMDSIELGWKLNKIGISQGILSTLINNLSNLLIYWLGCIYIINGTMSFGTLITFNTILTYFSGPLFRLINIQNQIQEALVATKRVGEILDLETELDNSQKYIIPNSLYGHITFENVTFAYGSRRPVYENLNLDIPAGSWTAFVGPSGCGKSTFVKLILKFYEVQEGKVFLDGNDIRDIDTTYLRSKIGYVPQDIFLFSGTIAENISLHNPNATLEEIMEAARKAGADEFIQKLPKRYETILGEHGGGLSGGEKQRLALARALLGNPSFIILDEATSSLDTVSEMEIHKVIKQLKSENIAVILIAHRLTTVMNCDKIFVMKEGQIIQQGTHKELLSEEGLYKEMWSEVNV